MPDSVRPHRLQSTRLCHPWDSPGKTTGVGCHFLLQCMKVKSESEVAQSCLTLCDPNDLQPIRLHHPSDFPGKRTGSGVPLPSPPFLLLPSIFPSIRVFSNEPALHIRWPKYWSFSFNISPPSEHPGLISFRMDWLDRLEVEGTLKSPLQHYSSKASILLFSAFFIVQPSSIHDYWKNHSLD